MIMVIYTLQYIVLFKKSSDLFDLKNFVMTKKTFFLLVKRVI